MPEKILHLKIEKRIFIIRGSKVMLDRDLAHLYGVTTMALNQAVKRNPERFPVDFIFRLTRRERDEVITICDNLRPLRFASAMPTAFTENGVAMLSSVLRSRRSIRVNIMIMRAFTRLRRFVTHHEEIGEILGMLQSLVGSAAEGRKVIGFQERVTV